MKQFFTILIGLLLVSAVDAQTRVTAQLDKTDILIGDQLKYELILELTPNASLESIDYSPIENSEVVEIIEEGKLDTISQDNSLLLRQDLILTSFDSGYHKVPPITIQYLENGQSQTAYTNDLAFNVRTIPITNDQVKLAPIKGIVTEPLNFWDILPYVLIVIGVFVLGFVIYYLLKNKEQKGITTPKRVIPAHEIALKKLKALQTAKLWQQGNIKQFQTELTFIVREYLENRYRIPALESTTEETLQMVKDIQEVDHHWNDKLKDMFQIADLVKFAKAKPPADFHDQILIDAENFVFETKEKPLDSKEEEVEPA